MLKKGKNEKSNLATNILKLFLTPCQIYTTSQSCLIPRARSEHVVMTFTVDVVTAKTGVETSCTLETRFVLVENSELYHPYSVGRDVVADQVESLGWGQASVSCQEFRKCGGIILTDLKFRIVKL